jgi:hypothetical protein
MWLLRRWTRPLAALVVFSLYFNATSVAVTLSDGPLVLTAYGEQCSDGCARRGFPYTWCHKRPSRNGTWTDRDYCSVSPSVTRYGEPCVAECANAQGAQPFFSCRTLATPRGDWDYCSPQSADAAGGACAWSQWGPWSACSATCGSRSTRTRRRRMEAEDGKVRHCSGEIEQSINVCRMPECQKGRKTCIYNREYPSIGLHISLTFL